MFAVRSSSTLRRVLWLDAASGLGLCLSHGLGSAVLTSWTGIPAYLLQLAAHRVRRHAHRPEAPPVEPGAGVRERGAEAGELARDRLRRSRPSGDPGR